MGDRKNLSRKKYSDMIRHSQGVLRQGKTLIYSGNDMKVAQQMKSPEREGN